MDIREILHQIRNGSSDRQINRDLGSYTVDLQALANWLAEHAITSVAMESLVLRVR